MCDDTAKVKLSDIRNQIIREHQIIKRETSKEEPTKRVKLVLFMSFDLDDFTELKSTDENWPEIIDILVTTEFEARRLWKFNGDEVIFSSQVSSLKMIVDWIIHVEEHLAKLNNKIATHYIESSKKSSNMNKKTISAKAAIWLAKVECNYSQDEIWKYNIEKKVGDVTDYIGKNIDEGFRLAKWTISHKVAIDPKIVMALLLWHNLYYKDKYLNDWSKREIENDHLNEFINQIEHISDSFKKAVIEANSIAKENFDKALENIIRMGYVKLKGVWCNLPYPIFWYCMSRADDTAIKEDKIFNGHMIHDSKVYGIIKKNKIEALKMLIDTFKDAGSDVFSEVKEILDILKVDTPEPPPLAVDQAKLYYMVPCYNPETRSILIAKRSKGRGHLKHVWDFGNVKLENNDMVRVISNEYNNTFGIDIDLLLDKERSVDEGGEKVSPIKPLGCCTIYRSGIRHIGILTCGIIRKVTHANGDSLEGSDLQDEAKVIEYINSKLNKELYQTVMFVQSEEDMDRFETLSYEETQKDSAKSYKQGQKEFNDKDYCITHFSNSIFRAIEAATQYLSS